MFDYDKWLEIFHTILQNPLRTVLTGVSVALGIFILVVMQGLGFGLQNGVMRQMQDDAINSMFIQKGPTSLAYQGMNPGRRFSFTNEDLDYVVENIEGVGEYSARVGYWNTPMTFGRETAEFGARGVHPGHQEIERTDLKSGRFIHEQDLIDNRKVAVLGQTIVDDLFRGRDPVGEFITIKGVLFAVVGYFEEVDSRWENRQAYIPVTTAQQLFGRSDRIDMFMITTGDESLGRTIEMAEEIDLYLRDKYGVHPRDQRAIRVRNNNEEFQTYVNVFTGIRLFIWVIGSFTLLAGMIGVGNIMSIVVKERTKEIGVRKALGAGPRTILSLIVQEAVFLSLVAGSFGLIVGVALLETISGYIDHEFFSNPEVNFAVCAIALALLVIAGALAGLVPALRAVNISPVEALRDE